MGMPSTGKASRVEGLGIQAGVMRILEPSPSPPPFFSFLGSLADGVGAASDERGVGGKEKGKGDGDGDGDGDGRGAL